EPVQQFVSVFDNLVPGWLALTLAVVLVVISQIKINVTNAYSGFHRQRLLTGQLRDRRRLPVALRQRDGKLSRRSGAITWYDFR
uniref:hypothetical protein n=1 Tax=Klebsiella pneumoniae TaxID=573 RepID=UPI00174B5F1B